MERINTIARIEVAISLPFLTSLCIALFTTFVAAGLIACN